MTDEDVAPCTHREWFRTSDPGFMECVNCGYTIKETRHSKFPNRRILTPTENQELQKERMQHEDERIHSRK